MPESETWRTDLARLEGEVNALQQVADGRMSRIERDVSMNSRSVKAAHERIDQRDREWRAEVEGVAQTWRDEIRELRNLVRDLLEWRAKVVGYAAGIAATAGLVSGGVTYGLARMIGS